MAGGGEPEQPGARTCIVVLAMHRSGTSALVRTLGLLGFSLPKTLMAGNEWNETGYGESLLIAQMNDRLLQSVGSSWADWRTVDATLRNSSAAAEFRREAVATIASEFEGSGSFVLKDPRMCRLSGFWADVFVEMGIRPLFVLPVRNPLEVAASVHRRDRIEPWLTLLVWQRHVLEFRVPHARVSARVYLL